MASNQQSHVLLNDKLVGIYTNDNEAEAIGTVEIRPCTIGIYPPHQLNARWGGDYVAVGPPPAQGTEWSGAILEISRTSGGLVFDTQRGVSTRTTAEVDTWQLSYRRSGDGGPVEEIQLTDLNTGESFGRSTSVWRRRDANPRGERCPDRASAAFTRARDGRMVVAPPGTALGNSQLLGVWGAPTMLGMSLGFGMQMEQVRIGPCWVELDFKDGSRMKGNYVAFLPPTRTLGEVGGGTFDMDVVEQRKPRDAAIVDPPTGLLWGVRMSRNGYLEFLLPGIGQETLQKMGSYQPNTGDQWCY